MKCEKGSVLCCVFSVWGGCLFGKGGEARQRSWFVLEVEQCKKTEIEDCFMIMKHRTSL